jgi:hypothetical protein
MIGLFVFTIIITILKIGSRKRKVVVVKIDKQTIEANIETVIANYDASSTNASDRIKYLLETLKTTFVTMAKLYHPNSKRAIYMLTVEELLKLIVIGKEETRKLLDRKVISLMVGNIKLNKIFVSQPKVVEKGFFNRLKSNTINFTIDTVLKNFIHNLIRKVAYTTCTIYSKEILEENIEPIEVEIDESNNNITTKITGRK